MLGDQGAVAGGSRGGCCHRSQSLANAPDSAASVFSGPTAAARGPWARPRSGPSRAGENGGLLPALQTVAPSAFCRNNREVQVEVGRKQRKMLSDEGRLWTEPRPSARLLGASGS